MTPTFSIKSLGHEKKLPDAWGVAVICKRIPNTWIKKKKIVHSILDSKVTHWAHILS